MVARLVPPVRLTAGTGIRLAVDPDNVYLFDGDGNAIR